MVGFYIIFSRLVFTALGFGMVEFNMGFNYSCSVTLFSPIFYTVAFYVVGFYMVLIHLIFGMVSFLYGWLVILWFFNMVGVLCLGFLIWLVFILLDFHTVCFYRVGFLYDWPFTTGFLPSWVIYNFFLKLWFTIQLAIFMAGFYIVDFQCREFLTWWLIFLLFSTIGF